MTKSLDIVVLSLLRWDCPFSSTPYSIAREMSRHHRVFYIDNPFTLKDVVTGVGRREIRSRLPALLAGAAPYRKIPGLPETFTAVTPRAVLPINRLPAGRLYRSLSRINEVIVRATLRRLLRDFQIRDYLYLNSFNPFYLSPIPQDLTPPLLQIYQTVDDIRHSKYVSRHGPSLEDEAVAAADVVLATSRELARTKSEISDRVHYLPNAAQLDLFSRAASGSFPRPAELEHVRGPVIGYVGAINERIDFALLESVARADPARTLLLVGPRGAGFERLELDRLPNVIFTGAKPLSDLPGYLAHIACTIIPFHCNPLTRSIYPLKVNEYLAAGKPVVSTAFSEDIAAFGNVVALASNHAEFISEIDHAIADDSGERIAARIRESAGNSWAARVQQLWKILDPYIQARGFLTPLGESDG